MKKMIQQMTIVTLLIGVSISVAQKSSVTISSEQLLKESKLSNYLLQVTVKTIKTGIITSYSADCYYSVSGSSITESGVCWSTKPNPTISNFHLNGQGNPSLMSALLTGLQASTKYYIKAYAKTGDQAIYGNEINFTTKAKNSNPNGSARPKSEEKQTPQKNQ